MYFNVLVHRDFTQGVSPWYIALSLDVQDATQTIDTDYGQALITRRSYNESNSHTTSAGVIYHSTFDGALFDISFMPGGGYAWFYGPSSSIANDISASSAFTVNSGSQGSLDTASHNPLTSSAVYDTSGPGNHQFGFKGLVLGRQVTTIDRATGTSTVRTTDYTPLVFGVFLKRIPTELPIRNGAGTGLLRGSNGLPLVDA